MLIYRASRRGILENIDLATMPRLVLKSLSPIDCRVLCSVIVWMGEQGEGRHLVGPCDNLIPLCAHRGCVPYRGATPLWTRRHLAQTCTVVDERTCFERCRGYWVLFLLRTCAGGASDRRLPGLCRNCHAPAGASSAPRPRRIHPRWSWRMSYVSTCCTRGAMVSQIILWATPPQITIPQTILAQQPHRLTSHAPSSRAPMSGIHPHTQIPVSMYSPRGVCMMP